MSFAAGTIEWSCLMPRARARVVTVVWMEWDGEVSKRATWLDGVPQPDTHVDAAPLSRSSPVNADGRALAARAGLRPPTGSERTAVYVWVLVPWVVALYVARALGPAPDAFSTAPPFERAWPVAPWTEGVYVSAYLFVAAAPLVARSSGGLRRLAVSGASRRSS